MKIEIDSVLFWFSGWAIFLAFAWVLPNHDFPWVSFHSEAWAALCFLFLLPVCIWILSEGVPIGCSVLCVMFILLALSLQYVFREIWFFDRFFVPFLYFYGFVLAIMVGQILERWRSGLVIDFLCISLVLASLASVFLLLCQWFDIQYFGVWQFGVAGGRLSANLGQPNHLATLILWGLVAIIWAYARQKVGSAVAIFYALPLLLGVALCQSKTSWLAVVIVVVFVWAWRRLWPSVRLPWVVTSLAGVFFAFVIMLPKITANLSAFDRGGVASQLVNVAGDARLGIWKRFLLAALDRPWFGYGFGNISEAYMLTAGKAGAAAQMVSYSHNILIDFALWWGLGGVVFISLVAYWFFNRLLRVKTCESAVVFLFLLILANHSMFEYPACYAYFLLYAGAFVGFLKAREPGAEALFLVSRRVFAVLSLLVFVCFGAVVLDYFKVESAYLRLRMEWRGFGFAAPPQLPDVLVLTSWREIIKQARAVPRKGMSNEEIDELKAVSMLADNPFCLHVFIQALNLNGREAEAGVWGERLCYLYGDTLCLALNYPVPDQK